MKYISPLVMFIALILATSGCATKPADTRGEFIKHSCDVVGVQPLPGDPAYAVYYDVNGNLITHTINGGTVPLVEVVKGATEKNHLCPAISAGPGACSPPANGCTRNIGGTIMCVPC